MILVKNSDFLQYCELLDVWAKDMTSCAILSDDIILNNSIQSSFTATYFTCTAYSLSQITFHTYLFSLLLPMAAHLLLLIITLIIQTWAPLEGGDQKTWAAFNGGWSVHLCADQDRAASGQLSPACLKNSALFLLWWWVFVGKQWEDTKLIIL